MIDGLRWFVCDEEGLTSVEYALLLSLLVGISIGAWTGLGVSVASKPGNVVSGILGPSPPSTAGSTTSHPWWWGYFYGR